MQNIVPAALDGEILGPNDGVRVIGAPHPLRVERVEMILPAGLSVAELIAAATATEVTLLPRRFAAYVNGDPVPEHLWSGVRLKSGTTLTFIARMEGGEMGRSVGMILTAVAAIAAAIFLGPHIGAMLAAAGMSAAAAATVGATIASTAVTLAGTMAVNALFPIRPPQLTDRGSDGNTTKPTYAIGGGRNQARPFDAIPVILGRHRMSPAHASKPYTEIVGQEQYLRQIFVWGYGPLDIRDLRIGETPITTFQDVEIETRYGYPDDLPIKLFPRDVFQEDLSVELQPSVWNMRTTAPDVDEVSIDITAPSGVFARSKETGNFVYYSVRVVAHVRALPSGPWVSLGVGYMDVGDLEQGTIRHGLRYKPGFRGQFEVRVQRQTPLYTGDDSVVEDVAWTALRGIRNEHPVQFDQPLAITAVRIRASSQLNGAIETLNGLVTSKVKAFVTAGWTNDIQSRNPPDLFRHVLQGAANARPVPDAMIDIAALEQWSSYCKRRGYTFDMIREERAGVYSVLADIAAAGRAVVVFKDGKWSVSFDDDADPVIVQHFSPRNSWGFSGTRAYRRMPHGWRVRFLNERKGYQQDERIVYDDGYSAANATLFEAIEFPGVTNPDLIWKHGRFHIAQARLRPETYKLQCDFENLVCTRGDRVRVTHDVPLWGQMSGRVLDFIAPNIVELDEAVIIEPAKAYSIRFRRSNGTSLLHRVSAEPGETRQVRIADPALGLPEPGDLFQFGELNRESTVLRVLTIEPGEDLTATLTLVDDAPEINDADTGRIPDFNPNISDPVDLLSLAPQSVQATEYIFPFGTGARAGVRISWQVTRIGDARSYEVQIRQDSGDGVWRRRAVVAAPQLYAEVLDLTPGVYSFRVRALFASGASDWAPAVKARLHGLLAQPDTVAGFEIAVVGDTATLSWDLVPAANVKSYEIRYSPLLSGVTWSTSSLLIPNAPGPQFQTPARVGTYLIKAVTQQGNRSGDAAIISTDVPTLTNFNAIEELVEAAPFSGAKVGTVYIPERSGVALEYSGDFYDAADFYALSDVYLGARGIASEGYYYFTDTVDLGAVYTSRVTSAIVAYGELLTSDFFFFQDFYGQEDFYGIEATDWSADVEISTTDDPSNPALQTGWSKLIVGDYKARVYYFRAKLMSNRFALTPVVTSLTVTVDMPDRVEAGNNITVPAGGRTITFAPAFKATPALARSDQDLATGDRAVVTAIGPGGFTIQYLSSGGVGVARTFDYVAKGFGRAVV